MNSRLCAFSVGVIILYCTGFLLPCYDEFFLYFTLLSATLGVARGSHPYSLMLFCLAGYSYASYMVAQRQQQSIPETMVGEVVSLTGYACGLPRVNDKFLSLSFCIRSGDSNELVHVDKLRLSAPIAQLDLLTAAPAQVSVRLKPPRGSLNPVGTSLDQYLFAQGFGARAWSKSGASLPLSELSPWELMQWQLFRWRWALYQALSDRVQMLDHGGILIALALGHRGDISDADNQTLQVSGLQHLMAISGLHVGLVMMLFVRVFPKRDVGVGLIAIMGIVYILGVGFSASSQRAWLMVLMVLMVVRGFVRFSWWRGYLLALGLVLLLDPLGPLSMGFWYSFLSVALVILCAQNRWFDKARPLRSLLSLQVVFFCVIAPINAWFGLPHSWAMLPSNLFAIPLISALVLPLTLLGGLLLEVAPDLSSAALWAANELTHLILLLSRELAHYLPEAKTIGWQAPWSVFLWLGYLATLFMALFVGRRHAFAWMLLAVCLIYVSWPTKPAKTSVPRLTVLDAGQGLSLVGEAGERVWVYDLGPAFPGYSVSDRALMPYLKSRHFPLSVDTLFLSHGDADHVGGAERFIERVKPGRVLSGEPERVNLPEASRCQPGDQSVSGSASSDAQWVVLYPPLHFDHVKGVSSNNRSCVVKMQLGELSVLMMGDLEGVGEFDFIKSQLGSLKTDVLIAGHHGSRFATSYALLKRVRPQYLVVSAGYRNRFGHPHKDVLERAQRMGVKVLSTADSGAIILSKAQGRLEVTEMRSARSAFWLWPHSR